MLRIYRSHQQDQIGPCDQGHVCIGSIHYRPVSANVNFDEFLVWTEIVMKITYIHLLTAPSIQSKYEIDELFIIKKM